MDIIKILKIFVVVLLDIATGVYVPYVTTDRKKIKQLITQCMNPYIELW